MHLFSNLFLIASLLLNSFSSLFPAQETGEVTVSPTYTVQESAARDFRMPERTAPAGTDWEDMDYEHYDPTLFYQGIDELLKLAEEDSEDKTLALYDRLYEEFVYIDTLYTIADIRFNEDVTDTYWSDELTYCDSLWTETADALSSACRTILEGSLAVPFTAHIGTEAAESFGEYEPMAPREAELSERETELSNRYYDALATAEAEAEYSYLGKTWTWEKLNGFPGDHLYNDDYEGYLEVYDGLTLAVNDRVGPIFTELVAIRAEIAEILGYDSYADYAYEWHYARDYTTADAQLLCDAVKTFSPGYFEDLYYADFWYEYDAPYPIYDSEELIAVLGTVLDDFGDTLREPYEFMTDHDLCVLTASPQSSGAGYTTTLSWYHSPAIFMTLSGDCYDFDSLSHEFGHYADAYYNPTPNLLTSTGSFDLFEIHSTGLEVLLTDRYDEIYSQHADTARFLALGSVMEVVITGCIQDEFQRRVYENPDMTLDEINRLYADINREYGMYTDSDMDCGWMYINHNYTAPLYYISYAVSALAALQLWTLAQEDLPAAVESYLSILAQGAYGDGYLNVLKNAGLRLFTEEDAVEEICQPVIAEMEAMDQNADF